MKYVWNTLLILLYLSVFVFAVIFVKSLFDNSSESKLFSDYNITQNLYDDTLTHQAETTGNQAETVPHKVEYEKYQSAVEPEKKQTALEKTVNTINGFFTANNKKKEDTNNSLSNETIKQAVTPNSNNTSTAANGSPLSCSTEKFTRVLPKNDGDNKIHYLAVGGGDATLIESNGHYGLIDSTNPRYNDGTAQAIISYEKETVVHVINYLKKIGVKRLDFIIGTHSHSDHIGGMVEIAKNFADSNTTYFYKNYVPNADDYFRNGIYNSTLANGKYDSKNNWDNLGYYMRTIEALDAKHVCFEEVTNRDMDFNFGDFNIKILNTSSVNDDESICIKMGQSISNVGQLSKKECEAKGGQLYASGENKNSLIQVITYKNSKNLLMGDMEKEDELRLLKDSKIKAILSDMEVVKLAHHGTNTSNRIEFVKVIKPKYAINSRETFYAGSIALLQQKYMVEKYNTNLLITGGVDDAFVQTYKQDGTYTMTNEKGGGLSNATFSGKPKVVSGNWYKYNLSGEDYWFYFDNEEVVKTMDWLKYKDKWYYLKYNGYAVTGWQYLTYNGKSSWYYFDKDCAMVTGWLKDKDKWYYLSEGGRMLTGWQVINYNGNDSWFYFKDSGEMVTGWQKIKWDNSTNWYYFDEKGVMLTGWQKLKWNGVESWYYFWPIDTPKMTDGAMVTGWQKLKWNGVENWYYFDNSGAMKTGFVIYNNKTYYLESNGAMVHDKCLTIQGTYYCFNSSGARTN